MALVVGHSHMRTPSRSTPALPVFLALVVLGTAVAGAFYLRGSHLVFPTIAGVLPPAEYERWARAEFYRRHPGEKPLNWRLAETAVTMRRLRPMGKFVLAVQPGQWGNDCSDFVDCIADEAFGARARCFRGSPDHLLGTDPRYFVYFVWDGRSPVMPGDLILVRDSPWYEPNPEAAGHIGIVGPDQLVYDFAKLRSWSQPRYGRTSFSWFVRYSRQPGEVLIGRLRPQYRYLIEAIPVLGARRAR
jgi:hypothetical protein